MEKTKFAHIVAADCKYLPELTALLNSLDYVGNKFDLHLVGIHLPEEFSKQFDKLDYNVIYHNIEEKEIEESRGISEVTCRKRYYYASKYGHGYQAVNVLDADIIFTRNPWQFFEIAAKTGFILGVSKEQNKVYDEENHKADGKWIIPKGYYNRVDICNCPLFLDTKIWGEALEKSWDIFLNHDFKAPDMDALAICLIEAGAENKTILLPNVAWLGTNEKLLKPYIRVTTDRGLLKSEFGEPIFSYHGHYYHKKWRETQLDNRHRCAEGYLGCSFNTDNMAVGAMEVLYSYFKKMLDYKIKIEHKDWRHTT